MRSLRTQFSVLSAASIIYGSAFAADPRPILATSNTDYLGYDGQWSTITIQVGTSDNQQWLSVFPSTLNQETWVISPYGCDGTIVCQTARGGLYYSNLSSTYQNRGYYELGLHPDWEQGLSGLYGLDTVALNDQVSAPQQVIATINTTEYWLGQLGLGVQQTRLNGSTNELPLLSSLVQNGSYIPSHSYGYTAGAYYRLGRVPTSLTLGGFDANRFIANGMSFQLGADYAPRVVVNSISVSSNGSLLPINWNSNPTSLLETSQSALFTIDSSTPFLWLPEEVCDSFAAALNLTYNETLRLYVFGNESSSPDILRSWNLNFTFSLSSSNNTADSIELSIPYDAFNLQLSFPFPKLDAVYGDLPTNYFPLRKAIDSSQYIIGRAFLQETYLVVDYERGNFSISQAVFTDEAVGSVNLNAISRPINSIFPGPQGSTDPESFTVRTGLSTGAKAGIGIGIAAAVIAMIALVWCCVRRRRKNQPKTIEQKPRRRTFFGRQSRSTESGTTVSELLGDKRQPTEIPADSSNSRFELAGNEPIEMPAGEVPVTFFASPDGTRASATLRNDPRSPAELEQRGLVGKAAEANAGDSERSGSPVPPYSPAQLSQRFSSNISPVSERPSQGFGTISSGEQGISPVGNLSDRTSNTVSSPVSPEGTSRSQATGSETNESRSVSGTNESRSLPRTNESRSLLGTNQGFLSPQVPSRTLSRSPSRGSRFVEEGLGSTIERSSSAAPGTSPRFSWEN